VRSLSEFVPVDPRLVVTFMLTLGVRLGGAVTVELVGGTTERLTAELVVE